MAEGSVSDNSSSSKSLMWMMIALFTGLAILLAAGLFMASRVVRSMGLSAASSKDTVRTPGGTYRLEKETQVGPGLPIYPRASLVVPDDQAAAAAIKQARNGIETSTYHTSDMREFVDTWYTGHLSPEFTRHNSGDKPDPATLGGAQVGDEDITFVAERNQMVRIVALSQDSGGTEISLIRFSKSKPSTDAAPAPEQPAPTTQDTPQ
ncbi:MAG TPA: hypothetical protein VMI32_03465 [Candidatus Solibacter sp.]|nr:hypothetical protein [Candidatus Solibacter sp.]